MNMEHWENDPNRTRPEHLEESLLECHCVNGNCMQIGLESNSYTQAENQRLLTWVIARLYMLLELFWHLF